MLALVCIVGLTPMKADVEIVDDTYFYCEKYWDFLRTLNRVDLTHPLNRTVQCVMFSFAFFMSSSGPFCRTFLINNFVLKSEKYNFSTMQKQGKILSNDLAAFISPSS